MIGFLVGGEARAGFVEDWTAMRRIVPQHYLCRYTATPLQIDGQLDEKAWRGARWTKTFRDIEGDKKAKPRFRTRAKMLWDSEYFYIGAQLEEPHVWGTLTNHDAVIFQDNDFEVFIDPNGDNHEYYEFEMNALNTGWDLFLGKPYKDGGPALNEWEIPGLKTGVKIRGTLNKAKDRDREWSLEIALPWKALAKYAHRPAPPQDGDQWRVNFSRVEWQIETRGGVYRKVPNTKEDNWVWSPQGIIDMHRPEKWGYVQFSRAKNARWIEHRDEDRARDLLHEVYYRQRAYHQANSRWADTTTALGWDSAETGKIEMRRVPEGFEATYALARDRWHIRQDAKFWKE